MDKNTPIKAITDGVVIFAEWTAETGYPAFALLTASLSAFGVVGVTTVWAKRCPAATKRIRTSILGKFLIFPSFFVCDYLIKEKFDIIYS